MRRVLIGCAVAVVCVGFAAAPAAAQDDGDDPELAEFLEEALQNALEEAGMSISEGLDSLLGEPGEFDLPAGDFVYEGLVQMAEDAELPDGGDSSLTGPCQGVAFSFESDGDLIDVAVDFDDEAPPVDLYGSTGDQAFTASNPFRVDVDGFVVYAGRADPAPINHDWEIVTLGLSLDSGGDPNSAAENRNAGSVNLGDDLPAIAKVNALFRIEGDMSADGGFECSGAGYFRTQGGLPVLGGAGLVIALLAGVGALFNARPARTWRGA